MLYVLPSHLSLIWFLSSIHSPLSRHAATKVHWAHSQCKWPWWWGWWWWFMMKIMMALQIGIMTWYRLGKCSITALYFEPPVSGCCWVGQYWGIKILETEYSETRRKQGLTTVLNFEQIWELMSLSVWRCVMWQTVRFKWIILEIRTVIDRCERRA